MRGSLASLLVVVLALASTVAGVQATELPKGLVEKLSADVYREREQAHADLSRWAEKNSGTSPEILLKAWRASGQPEAKGRLFLLMKESVIRRKFGRGKGFVGIAMDGVLLRGEKGGKPQLAVKITMVLADTPASKVGLKVGDVILGVDDLDFRKEAPRPQQARHPRPQQARHARVLAVRKCIDRIQSKQPGDVVTLHLMRKGKKLDVKITLVKRPDFIGRGRFGGFRERGEREEKERFLRTFFQWLAQAAWRQNPSGVNLWGFELLVIRVRFQ